MATPTLQKVVSFSLDIDDWYSCTASDDEAYQDALERNSSASFYTARGAASSAASCAASVVYASAGEPIAARLADADRALEEMVPEPLSDPRLNHEPPEMDEDEVPSTKRTRSVPCNPLPAVASAHSAQLKSFRRPESRRTTSSRITVGGALESSSSWEGPLMPSQLVMPTPSALRVSLSASCDNTSVQLRISPAVFCFGNVSIPLPNNLTDYSAMLLGPDGGLSAENSSIACGELQFSPTPQQTRSPQQMSADSEEEDDDLASLPASKSLVQQDTAAYKDPFTPKDQTKTKRRPEDKDRKPGGFFGSFLLQRLFSGLRSSGGGADAEPLPPVTAQELGAELLLASSAAAPAGLELAVASAQQAPVVACYVHGTTSGPAAALENDAALDEAAAAAQRLSADIFRNVIRASAGGAAPPGAHSPKPPASPRDTSYQAVEALTPQRDQAPLAVVPSDAARSPGKHSPPASPSHHALVSAAASPHRPLDEQQQEPGAAALALLVGLAADNVPGATGSEKQDQAAADEANSSSAVGSPGSHGHAAAGDALDGGDLPALEKCESPMTAKGEQTSIFAEGIAPAASPGSATPSATVAATAAETGSPEPTHDSPRTVSKKAYGTIARLVKKMAPDYRDSAVKSIMSVDMAPSPLRPQAVQDAEATSPALPREDEEAPTAVPAESDTDDAEEGPSAEAAVPSGSADVAPAGAAPPPMFVFGLERPKGGKHSRSKSRPSNKDTSAPRADPPTPTEAPGRKRKSDLEVLPSAKRESAAAESGRAQVSAAPEPAAVSPSAPIVALTDGSTPATQEAAPGNDQPPCASASPAQPTEDAAEAPTPAASTTQAALPDEAAETEAVTAEVAAPVQQLAGVAARQDLPTAKGAASLLPVDAAQGPVPEPQATDAGEPPVEQQPPAAAEEVVLPTAGESSSAPVPAVGPLPAPAHQDPPADVNLRTPVADQPSLMEPESQAAPTVEQVLASSATEQGQQVAAEVHAAPTADQSSITPAAEQSRMVLSEGHPAPTADQGFSPAVEAAVTAHQCLVTFAAEKQPLDAQQDAQQGASPADGSPGAPAAAPVAVLFAEKAEIDGQSSSPAAEIEPLAAAENQGTLAIEPTISTAAVEQSSTAGDEGPGAPAIEQSPPATVSPSAEQGPRSPEDVQLPMVEGQEVPSGGQVTSSPAADKVDLVQTEQLVVMAQRGLPAPAAEDQATTEAPTVGNRGSGSEASQVAANPPAVSTLSVSTGAVTASTSAAKQHEPARSAQSASSSERSSDAKGEKAEGAGRPPVVPDGNGQAEVKVARKTKKKATWLTKMFGCFKA